MSHVHHVARLGRYAVLFLRLFERYIEIAAERFERRELLSALRERHPASRRILFIFRKFRDLIFHCSFQLISIQNTLL